MAKVFSACTRAASPSERHSAGSAPRRRMAAARLAASPGANSRPVRSCSIISTAPPWSGATIGRAIVMASMIMVPRGSGEVDADSTTSSPLYTGAISLTWPVKTMRPRSGAASAANLSSASK